MSAPCDVSRARAAGAWVPAPRESGSSLAYCDLMRGVPGLIGAIEV